MRPVGHIEPLGDGRWSVEVERGYRSDGTRRREYRTVSGTYADAQIVAASMASAMGRSDAYGDSVTLLAWYNDVFRDRPTNRGTPKATNTLYYYDREMARNIAPMLGAVPLSRITHEMCAACVRASSSPNGTKLTLRAVLRAAYDDGLIPERPMDRRIPVHVEPRPAHEPWSRFEAARALAAEWPDPRLAAFCVLGLSGLRKEEALGARPLDVSLSSTYSVATGESVESMVVGVRWTRTARGGHVDALKNGQSARVVPVVVPGRELLSASLRSLRESAIAGCRDDAERAAEALSWAQRPIVDMPYTAFDYRWGKALRDMGLRFIPPKVLRHTSTTIMETAGVSHDLADKMHGRSDHGVAYRNYYRPDAALMEDAAGRVAAVLTLPPRPSPVDGMPGNDVPAGGHG